jgi:hypothetical protein
MGRMLRSPRTPFLDNFLALSKRPSAVSDHWPLLTTAGGINEQFLKHLVEHRLLTRVSEALDAVLHGIAWIIDLISGQVFN